MSYKRIIATLSRAGFNWLVAVNGEIYRKEEEKNEWGEEKEE